MGLAGLAGGLAASLSRGPWVGAVVLWMVFLGAGRSAIRSVVLAASAAVLVLVLLPMFPGGDRILALLPWVGTIESETISYREQLMTNAWIVIQRNPWFGSIDFMQAPEMEALRQGHGIIDIVNTYVRTALETGLVGLGLFVGFFGSVLFGIRRGMKQIRDDSSEEYLLGRSLLATLAAILIIIATVSSITVIPTVYWSVAALGVGYLRMTRTIGGVGRTESRLARGPSIA
jgi:O-antigen ligase